ncbi:MAG TPA: DUF2235 domain-containing protein [Nitrospiraceae bacterium]|nr:DUF2235 domain-containing protein [Nitrospiraceae bacterium]
MPKNIVICSDGTGNSAIKGRGTNVFKLFEAIDLNGHKTRPELTPQVALYDDGVGTEDFKPLKIFAGATGYGLSRNVKQLYKELVRIYDPDDRLFFFGFSRGAFTVRTLVGLIAACGILDVEKFQTAADLDAAVNETYRVYRKSYRTALAKLFLGDPDTSLIAKFRSEHCLACEVPIAFMGVWDTVDAVGLPFHLSDFINMVFYRFKFRDHKLSKLVKHACHALAIDDERHSFHPILWHEEDDDAGRIEQVWFAGAHSNVGGGYPKQGMSLVALEWMMRKAERTGGEGEGLRLLAADRALYYDHANVDDKLYDPRSGLGIFYRWKVRDIAEICRMHHARPAVHLSVLERIAHGTDDYAPGNLPSNADVVITPTDNGGKETAAQARAKGVEAVLRSAHAGEESLLSRVRTEISIGLTSYYLYVGTFVFLIVAVSTPDGIQSLSNPWLVLKNMGLLIYNILTLRLGEVWASVKALAMSPGKAGFVIGGFLVAYVLMLYADRRMNAVFSQFWHRHHARLRDALKEARRIARNLPTGKDTKVA